MVSAVGHETDFTISDFVSDLRAPTPSAAAEIVFPNNLENLRRLASIKDSADGIMQRRLSALRHKTKLFESELQKKSPVYKLRDRTLRVSHIAERLEILAKRKLDSKSGQMKLCAARLASANPMAVLSKGYTFVETESGRIVSKADELSVGERINLVFSNGRVGATVENVSEDK